MSDLETRPTSFGVPVLPPHDASERPAAAATGVPLPPPGSTAVAAHGPPTPAEYSPAGQRPIAGVTDRSQDVIGPPRSLLPHAPLRAIAVVANLAALPFGVLASVGDWSEEARVVFLSGAMISPTVSLVAIILWSAIASINARRVRARNRHLRLPGALDAALSWFSLVALISGLAIANELLSAGGETGVDRLLGIGGDGEELGYAIGGAVFLLLILVMYRPYAVLRKVSRWVSGADVRFRTWFLAPIFGGALSGLIVVFSALVGLSEDGVPPPVLATALVVAAALPWVFWLVAGHRAMTDLEAATQRLHGRALEEHRTAKARFADT